jgi:serine/threonine protein kinase
VRQGTDAALPHADLAVPFEPVDPLLPADPRRAGRYELEGRLGTGGMGTVYLGRSPGGRLAAVKMLDPFLLAHPDTLVRFRREAETLRKVRSAYTAALIDCELTDPPYWMATEFIPGATLADAVEAEGPMTTGECLRLMASLAEGLAEVHAQGICHRDIKPQNVILSTTGPQLIDFGLARDPSDTGLTQSGIIVGTPGYIAPELLTDDRLSPAADVFALGATVAHAATGRRPYGAGSAQAICQRLLREEIDLDGVDARLAGLIRSCVAGDPERRPTPEQIVSRCHHPRLGDTDPHAAAMPPPVSWSGASVAIDRSSLSGPVAQVDTPPPATGVPRRRGRRLGLALGAVAAATLLFAGGVGAAVKFTATAEDAPAAPAAQASPVPSPTPSVRPSVRKSPSKRPTSKAPVPVKTTRSKASPSPKPSTLPPVTTVTSLDGRCIQTPAETTNGVKLSAAKCTGAKAQRWTFTREGALMPATATKCLDIGGNAGADIEYRIQLWDCNFGGAQLWVPQTDGALFNAGSGRCLSILPKSEGGPALAILPCTGKAGQRWRLPR